MYVCINEKICVYIYIYVAHICVDVNNFRRAMGPQKSFGTPMDIGSVSTWSQEGSYPSKDSGRWEADPLRPIARRGSKYPNLDLPGRILHSICNVFWMPLGALSYLVLGPAAYTSRKQVADCQMPCLRSCSTSRLKPGRSGRRLLSCYPSANSYLKLLLASNLRT